MKTISNYEDIFIGDDAYCYSGKKRYMKKEPFALGNSILIKLSKHKYISIGWKVEEFKTEDEIVKYVSPIGNSDVPYPYAIGTKYTYLMIENIYIENEFLKIYGNEDPYDVYYGFLHDKKKKENKKILENL